MTIIAKAKTEGMKTLTPGEWYEVTYMFKRGEGWIQSNRIEDSQIIGVINNKGIERRYSKRHFSEFGIGVL